LCEELSASPVVGPPRRVGPFKVWFIEKGGQRHDVSLRLDDPLPEREVSDTAAEYRLRITAYYLRGLGWSKDRVAAKLGRAQGWVTLWWQTVPEEVPRPRDIPPYVADYNMRMLKAGIEPFRPAVLKRRYATDTVGLYEECAQQMPWRQAVFRRRNYQTGGVTVTNIASSRQDSSYVGLKTGVPRLDVILERMRVDLNITDPRVYLLNNFYPDGNTSIAPHTHDFWSAIVSFGASRVFTVDGHPVLLGDGDLLVIGTQRHAVPKMPAVTEGRVSVAIFWYPENTRGDWPALDGTGCDQCGQAVGLTTFDDGSKFCEECCGSWEGGSRGMTEDDAVAAEEDLLAAALNLSLEEY